MNPTHIVRFAAFFLSLVGPITSTRGRCAWLERPPARDASQRRAEAVVRALVAAGIDPRRLLGQGVASLAPVANNADKAGRARNRRVELVTQ